MNRNKRRIRLTRNGGQTTIGQDGDQSDNKTADCQIEIPGIGRLRTGECHPNFHAVRPSDNSKREIAKQQ
jgi:hypothetical protein